MLQPMGSQRVGHDLVAEQARASLLRGDVSFLSKQMACSLLTGMICVLIL